ncbi:MAG: S24 family peptidase [Parcubacteria group bacterium]|jgi:repressor LexA
MKTLHSTQKKLLELLKEHFDDPLTIRELQEKLDVSSTSLVHHHILQLEKNGFLKRNPNNPQDYEIIADSPDKKIIFLNLYGLAHCGPGESILDGSPVDRIPLSRKLVSSADSFLVKAKGDSMYPKINNGDLVITKKTNNFDNGDIVVCVNNGGALIKKIRKEKDHIWLFSINEKFEPFLATEDFKVEGLVKGVISYNLE